MNKPICFYHSADFDGMCSGAIVRNFIPDAEMIGYDYGQPFPWEKVQGRDVYMVDVSLPAKDMRKLAEMCDLVWIDHHKSAIQAVEEIGLTLDGLQRIGDAACELCWEYFYGEREKPLAVHLLGRYDVWDHDGEPRAMPFQYGARAKILGGVDDLQWVELLMPHTDGLALDILDAGYSIWHYQQASNERYAGVCAFETELDGMKVIAINKGLTNSTVFDTVWDPDKYHMMSSFYRNKRGQWRVSLYTTRQDVDCSAIATKYGGGGHQQAAGFTTPSCPY